MQLLAKPNQAWPSQALPRHAKPSKVKQIKIKKSHLDIVPNSPAEGRRVYGAGVAQVVVGHMLGDAELVVQQQGHVRVEPGHHGEALLVPREVLRHRKISSPCLGLKIPIKIVTRFQGETR